MKVFLDANIIFSAAKSTTGASAYIFEIAEDFKLRLLTCAYAQEEAERNLLQKSPESVQRFKKLVLNLSLVPTVITSKHPEGLVKKDVPIFCSAQSAGAKFLLTLDQKDFGFILQEEHEGLTALLPKQFLEWLRNNS